MWNMLIVGAGGAAGAMGRYGISLLPWKGDFPLLTLATNLLGAILIGFVVGLSEHGTGNSGWTMFWKTGVCGGFTTFSTFSLESVDLFQKGHWLLGASYGILSVGLCLLGVIVGRKLADMLR